MSIFNHLLGNIILTKRDNIYTVKGVKTYVLQKDINRLYKTSRVGNNIIFDITRYSFSFHEFFLPDLCFVIDKMLNERINISRKSLSDILFLLKNNTWVGNKLEKKEYNSSSLSNLKWKPFPHQDEFIKFFLSTVEPYNLVGTLLSAATGSGKTMMSISLSEVLGVDTVIVISPLPAMDRVWRMSLDTIYNTPPTYWLSTSNTKPDPGLKYYVCHFEYLDKFIRQIDFSRLKSTLIVIDECHNFNNIKSERTKQLIKLCKKVDNKKVVAMSGTPVKALAIEVVPLLHIIDPSFDELSDKQFRAIYRGNNTKSVEILNHRLGRISFNVEKKELKLKDPITKTIKLKIKNGKKYTLDSIKKEMKVYIADRTKYYKDQEQETNKRFYEYLDHHEKQLKNNSEYLVYRDTLATVIKNSGGWSVVEEMAFCTRYEKDKILPTLPRDKAKDFKNIKSIVKYVHLKIMGECLGNVLGGARKNCYRDMALAIDFTNIIENAKKKTIVFTNHVDVGEAIYDKLKVDHTPIRVYGTHTGRLSQSVKEFDEKLNVNPLIATYASLSTAVPLIMADTIILIDLPFREYILSQAIGRVHRLGNDGNTYVYKFTLDTGESKNIVERSKDILTWAKTQVEEITGVKSDVNLDDVEISNEDIDFFMEKKNKGLRYYNW